MINLIVFVPIIAAFLIGIFGSGKKIAFVASSINLVFGVFIFLELFYIICSYFKFNLKRQSKFNTIFTINSF